MFPDHRSHSASSDLTLSLTVADMVSVQRVLVVLTGRSYHVTRLEAEQAGGGRWLLRIDCAADDADADLLRARLQRLPSVLAVELCGGAGLAAAQ